VSADPGQVRPTPPRGGGARLAHALTTTARLRCPRCGRGALFKRLLGFEMHRSCPVCGLVYDRGEGYFIGALGLNLVVTEFASVAIWLPLALDQSVPINQATAVGVVASVLLPILGYKPSRSLWLATDWLFSPR
jgi:uncharacterized protein (DUF983 family)